MKLLIAIFAVVLAAAAALPTSGAIWADARDSTGAVASRQPIRVTTYEIGLGQFTGTSYTLTLNQSLDSNYFVMIRGAAGYDTNSPSNPQVTSRPSSDSVRVTRDPYHLLPSTPANQLELRRETDTMISTGPGIVGDWQGTVTVVESPTDQATDGFVLKDVVEITLTPESLTGTTGSSIPFSPAKTVPYGGIRGGGVATTATLRTEYRSQWARFWLSGTDTVNAEGSGIPSGHSATYTIYVVEWGANWTIQHAYVNGSEWGNGVDSTSEYTTTALPTAVTRANSWVVGYGHTSSGSLGGGWHGQVFTLGDGVAQNAMEDRVAVGAERSGNREADVYVHTHPRLSVNYVFGSDGSIGSSQSTGTIAVPGALAPETYTGGGVASTTGTRLAVFVNSSNGPGRLYPRPIFWVRHESDTTIAWQRARSGQQGAYWSQSADFGEIWR